jgi:rRNA maturation RNase YbeY
MRKGEECLLFAGTKPYVRLQCHSEDLRVHVQVVNRQSITPVNTPAIRKLAAHLAARLTASSNRRWTNLTVLIADDSGARIVKTRCFGRSVATDVVAAAYRPVPCDEPSGWTADIVINAERAAKAARYSGTWSPAKELALYLAHGVDHLCGGRDNTAKGRQAMRRRELRWLRDADRIGLTIQVLRKTPRAQRPRRARKMRNAD